MSLYNKILNERKLLNLGASSSSGQCEVERQYKQGRHALGGGSLEVLTCRP